MVLNIEGYTLQIYRDDRGRLRSELRDKNDGLVEATEVDNYEMGRWWGSKLVNTLQAAAGRQESGQGKSQSLSGDSR